MSGTVPAGQPVQMTPEMQQQVDDVVKQRLAQAFDSVFGRVLQSTERAAKAAEAQASVVRSEGLTKMMKMDAWKPSTREEELRTWKDWQFQLVTWLTAYNPKYSADLEGIGLDSPRTTAYLQTMWSSARRSFMVCLFPC